MTSCPSDFSQPGNNTREGCNHMHSLSSFMCSDPTTDLGKGKSYLVGPENSVRKS